MDGLLFDPIEHIDTNIAADVLKDLTSLSEVGDEEFKKRLIAYKNKYTKSSEPPKKLLKYMDIKRGRVEGGVFFFFGHEKLMLSFVSMTMGGPETTC